jgi:fused signal recognition particle receptor
MQGGITMADQEERSLTETKRKEKRATDEIEQSAKDQARRKANLAREQRIEKDLEARKTKESEKRAAEEPGRLAKDQARRRANLAREQAIVENQDARQLKSKKQTRN